MAKIRRKDKHDGDHRHGDTTALDNGTSSSRHTLPRVSLSSDNNREGVVSRSNSKKHRTSSVSRVNPNGSFNTSLLPQSTPNLKSETKAMDETLPAAHLLPPAFPVQIEHPLPVREDVELELGDSHKPTTEDNIVPTKSDSHGFLSSLLNAAHNAATIMMTPQDENGPVGANGLGILDGKDTSFSPSNKPKKETFTTRLEQLLKPGKLNNTPVLHEDEHAIAGKSSNSEHSASKEEIKESVSPISTANVHFEPLRESPLNSLGEGDLTLDSFENRKIKPFELAGMKTAGAGKDIAEKPTNNGINSNNIHTLINGAPSVRNKRSDSINRRLMITPNHSTDNLADVKRSLSPGIVNRALPTANQLTVSGNVDSKKVHRRSFGNHSSTDLARLRSHSLSRMKSNEGSDDDSELSDLNALNTSSKPPDLNEIVDYSKIKFAPKKKNKEFHSAFKNVPHGDRLIEDCSCALSKDFLVQGRMYISEHYICFNSNILGWVTNLVIPLQEVIQIEKKSTAVLFPNGMIIRTLHHKYVFATFLSRDSIFNLITNIWHRVLVKSSGVEPSKLLQKVNSLNMKAQRNRTSSVTSNSDGRYDSGLTDDEFSDDDLDSVDGDSDDEVPKNKNVQNDDDSFSDASFDSKGYNMDNSMQDHDDDEGYVTEDGSCIGDDLGDITPGKKDKSSPGNQGNEDGNFNGFPVVGPLTHAPTSSNYTKDSSETFICEETIKGPLGVVFLLLFGNDTSHFIKILKAQKNFEIAESDIVGLSQKRKERHYTYTKPLGGPIGPKQTKCHVDDKLVDYQLEKSILVEQITSTPDVPSGNAFKVRTKLFFSWAPHNNTKLYVVTGIEWSGKSWIKGAIEKGSIDGQKESMKTLIDKANEILTSGTNSSANGSKSKGKSKKKRSRKNTIKKDKSQSSESTNQVSSENKSIATQLNDLVTSIGQTIPIQIPFVSDFVVGLITISFGIIFARILVHSILGTLRNSFTIEGISTGQPSYIKINENKYLVIPSVDTNFENKRSKMESEVELWKWIQERSSNNMHVKSTEYAQSEMRNDDIFHEYSQQEIREIIGVTELKLEKLNERLNLNSNS